MKKLMMEDIPFDQVVATQSEKRQKNGAFPARAKGLGCTSAQPALPFPARGKRAQHLFILIVNHPSCSMSAASLPFRQNVHRFVSSILFSHFLLN